MRDKKFCLLQVPSEAVVLGRIGAKLPPLSLGIIAGYLRTHEIEMDMFDLATRINIFGEKVDVEKLAQFYDKEKVYAYIVKGNNEFYEEFAENALNGLDWEQYDIIGISIGPDLTFLQTFCGMIIGAYIKKVYNKTLIFGGFNLTTYVSYQPIYDEFFEILLDNLGYVINGPGEESLECLIRLLRCDYSVSDADIRNVEGLCYKNEFGELVFNKFANRRVVMPDFDGLILSDYENYINPEAYEETMVALYRYPFAFTKKMERSSLDNKYTPYLVIPYIFNYNCPYNCSFCTESNPEAPRPVIGAVQQTITEIKLLKEKYKSPYFYFINNAINLSKKYVRDFCQALIDQNIDIYWSDCARFDNTDREILELMYRAGCRKVVFGMESGCADMVKLVNKKIDLSYAEQVLEWCREIGIWAELEIIIGMPGETQEYFEESFQYVKKNINNISFYTTNHYIPMPGSIMYRYPERYQIVIEGEKDLDKILELDKQILLTGKNPGNYNNTMRIYNYSEIDGRDAETVSADTKERIARIRKLLLGKVMKEMMGYLSKGYVDMADLKELSDI